MGEKTDKNPMGNLLRADLYTRLLPEILREDLKTGVESYINFWDDPTLKWDDGHLWDELGLLPVLKNVFYGIEQEEVADLTEIDHLTDLVDPNICPEEYLDYMAQSLGHPLESDLTDTAKRETIKSIIQLNKTRGRELSWAVFYRMLGFKILGVPLWKQDVYEENENYSRSRYTVDKIENETIGTPGLTNYSGSFANSPIQPGSIRIHANGKTYRDEGNEMSPNYGKIVAADGSVGSISYAKGEYVLEFSSITTTNVTADYHHITAEFPYRAARVDLEIFFYLSDEENESTDVPFDLELLKRLLARLEMVRPIHVLVRLVILILDAPEILEDFCTDEMACGPQMGKDVRSDEYRFYAADLGTLTQDGATTITKSGATEEVNFLVDDLVGLCQAPDELMVEFSDGRPPQYW